MVETALSTGKPTVDRQIQMEGDIGAWCDKVIHKGYVSAIALPISAGTDVFGLLAIYSFEADAFDEEEVELLTSLADNLAYGIVASRLLIERERAEEALRESERQLRYLSSQLIKAQEEERKRIARELHDSIGSSLSAIKFSLENTLSSMEKGTAAIEPVNILIKVVQSAIDEARRMMGDLRPSMLDDLGIVTTIGWLCRQCQSIYSNIYIEEQLRVDEEDIPEHLKIVIFRIIQEAFHNITKYSEAELVNVTLEKAGNTITLIVEDNGKGFDLHSVISKVDHKKGLGLTSMKERTELCGGRFSITSTIGEGTTICAAWTVEHY
jgi:signal transduction histidine kinase